jgi:hypothetical protein
MLLTINQNCFGLKRYILGLVSFIFFQYSFSERTGSEINYSTNETVNFSLKYGIVKIGEADLELGFDKKCNGKNIQADAKSTGLLKLFKDIHFRYECCMDTLTGLPISDSRILVEDNYSDISTVYYDHVSRKDSSLIYSKKTDTVAVPKNIYDLLSGFYHYRTNYLGDNLPLNYTVKTTTFFIDKVWDLTIRYCGKEVITTIYGPMECIKVKPVTIIGHFFRTTDAMTIWFADKGKYIPVKFSIDFKLGTLHGNITDYKSNNVSLNLK